MRKALLLVLTIIISLSTNADGISVVGFRLLDTDLTANTRGTSRTDQNGEIILQVNSKCKVKVKKIIKEGKRSN